MAVIAMIDDRLHDNHLKKNWVSSRYAVIDGDVIKREPFCKKGMTHSTLCAQVLENHATGYEIISLQIAENMNGKCENIAQLATALEFCAQNPVDILSISLGTKILSEGRALQTHINTIVNHGATIVAALSNDDFLTFPASHSSVIGVRSDAEKVLDSGACAVAPPNPMGVDCIVNQTSGSRSNSTAVPIMIAQVNEAVNKGFRGKTEILAYLNNTCLETYPTQVFPNFAEEMESSVPHLCIALPNSSGLEWIQSMMDQMLNEHGYESLCITPWSHYSNHLMINSDYFLDGHKWNLPGFVDKHTTADLLISAVPVSLYPRLIQSEQVDILCVHEDLRRHFESYDLLLNFSSDTVSGK